jgi:DNA helicase HerA-like ATPase
MNQPRLLAWLGAASGCRIVEVPRPVEPAGDARAASGRQQRHAAVVAAYHAAVTSPPPEPLLFGWCRPLGSGPIEVYAAGQTFAREQLGGATSLALPPGALGHPTPPGALAKAFCGMPVWTRIAGIVDGLLATPDRTPAPGEARPSFEELLLRVWPDAFAWLLLAEPLPPGDVAHEADAVAGLERDARTRASSPEHAVRTTRLQGRHRELRQAGSTGAWRVHLLAGGADERAAAAIAGLFCASVDLTDLPYALAPVGRLDDLSALLRTGSNDGFVASSLLVAALAAPPAVEVPGVRLTLRSPFDVTPETADAPGAALLLGSVLDRNGAPVDDFRLPHASVQRHTFVCGATGAGKSQTIRHLLEQASAAGVPWLVIEPAKAEYRSMADRLGAGEVIAVRPGDPLAAPVGLNPLEPAPGFPLQTHADLVRALFLAAFAAEEPFPQVLAAALTRCYEELGWDLAIGSPADADSKPRYPRLSDLQRTAEQVVNEIGYGREVADNVRGFVRVRLDSLRLGTTGRFFEGGHPIDIAELMRRNVVFEIEDVGDDRDKAFLMGTVLIRLVEHLRTAGRARGSPTHGRGLVKLRHLSVFEEAHRLLRRAVPTGPVNAAGHAVEMFAAMLAEIRAYGEGLVIAEQIPSKLVADVIKNTAVKIVHRLPALDDREAVGATINLSDEQSRYVVTLSPGTAAVFSDGMDNPVLVRMPDGTQRETGSVAALGPDALTTHRRATCGTECRRRPCVLTEIVNARRFLGHPDTRWVAVWAELAVLAHLTGWPAPVLTPRCGASLIAQPRRLLECAFGHAAEAAVASRASALVGVAAPDELAAHVARAMLGALTGSDRCALEERQWLARPYRWVLVREALAHAAPGGGPYPRSDEWARAYGQPIPGRTVEQQRAIVDGWCRRDQRDPTARSAVAYGVATPSTLELALGCTRASIDEWTEAVTETLARFIACRWPLRYLVPEARG